MACMRNYALFNGRSTRAEYISFTLVNMFIVNGLYYYNINTIPFGLVITIPALSVTTRRLHDLNHSGWFIAVPWGIFLLAVIGFISMPENYFAYCWGIFWVAWSMLIMMDVWLCFFRGTSSCNRYGENPLGTE